MYRLNIRMQNGNTTFFDFLTHADAVEYRDARNMATNKAIKSTNIQKISFNTWRLAHVRHISKA